MIPIHFTATLSKKKFIAENTAELTFLVSNPNFSFTAGQYVSIEIPSLSGATVLDRYHDFSIASSPQNSKEISIAFRVSKSIFKTALLALPVGGVVNIDGPKGALTLPEPERPDIKGAQGPAFVSQNIPIIFVAGGIGITPLLSMIRYATETKSPQQITLLYCNSRKETTAYTEELYALEQKNPQFKLVLLLGTFDEHFFETYVQNTPNALWYIIGAPAIVKKVRQFLAKFGIMDTQIRIEEFSGYNGNE